MGKNGLVRTVNRAELMLRNTRMDKQNLRNGQSELVNRDNYKVLLKA